MTGENLICPYCGAVQETHEPDEISAIMCRTECERCDREVWYSVDVRRSSASDTYAEDEQ